MKFIGLFIGKGIVKWISSIFLLLIYGITRIIYSNMCKAYSMIMAETPGSVNPHRKVRLSMGGTAMGAGFDHTIWRAWRVARDGFYNLKRLLRVILMIYLGW